MSKDCTKKIKLSILVPTYNVDKYVKECLDSIAVQITDDCELIIYDDASTDETLSIIRKHPITKTNNCKLIQGHENKGLSVARNNLKKLCFGDYIWFIDSDDKILDGSIEKILNTINNFNPNIIFFNYIRWFELKTKQGSPIGDEIKTYHKPSGFYYTDSSTIFSEILKNGNLQSPFKIFHKNLFIKGTEFPVGRIFEDINVTPILASLSKTLVYIDEPFYAYRHRYGSITSTIQPQQEIEPLRSTENLRLRYEIIHGSLSKSALSAITHTASLQTRIAIKNIIKNADKKDTPKLLNDVVQTYKQTHKQNIINVLYTCYKNAGLGFAFQIGRRLLQAKIVSKRNTI